MQRKACTKCGETKPLDEFHRDKRNRDGRRSDCKECVNRRNNRYNNENRERLADYKHRYRENNREQINEYNRRYYEENREKNREKIAERSRRYLDENREVVNAKKLILKNGYQSGTSVFAVNHHQPWALDEDEFLMEDNGMTAYQKAIHLGRTYRSVTSRRRKLLEHEQDRARALRRQ